MLMLFMGLGLLALGVWWFLPLLGLREEVGPFDVVVYALFGVSVMLLGSGMVAGSLAMLGAS